ncbi:helix-turn-helix domain-containing protein [Luteimonas sp. A482]
MTNGGAALSDPTRRRVLQLLRSGPLSAGELSDQFDVSKPTMSAHFVPIGMDHACSLDVFWGVDGYEIDRSSLLAGLVGRMHFDRRAARRSGSRTRTGLHR